MRKNTACNRGFVTIATGNQKYYQMASNLLKSYRIYGQSSLPFAIICDKDCAESREFDDMILINSPCNSYMDKLSLYQNMPYEETIFIDADSLILSSVDNLWADFESMGDFSCYGKQLPLDSNRGWYIYEGMGELKAKIPYVISMHGGLYYMRKTDTCRIIFENAKQFAKDYYKYSFTNFVKPADEPVLALAMAISNCIPCDREGGILFFRSIDGKIRVDLKGELKLRTKRCNVTVLHFGNRNLPRFLYQYLLANINHIAENKVGTISIAKRLILRIKCLPADIKYTLRRIIVQCIPPKLKDKIKRRRR